MFGLGMLRIFVSCFVIGVAFSVSFWSARASGSIVTLNNKADSGSPCPSPLLCLMRPSVCPFTYRAIWLWLKSIPSRLRKFGGKLSFCRTVKRKSREAESKALSMSADKI